MKKYSKSEEEFVATLINAARAHPSQAAKSIQHLLQITPTQLVNMQQQSKKYLHTWLENLPTNVPELPEISEKIREQQSFSLRPAALVSIEITHCRNFILDLSQVEQKLVPGSERPKFTIRINHCKNFRITGGHFSFSRNVIIIEDSEIFSVSDLLADNTEGYAITIFNSRTFEIRNCLLRNGLASGIYCLGETSHGWIHGNTCDGGRGYFNWDAGLHINHCTNDVEFGWIPERSHENKSIVEKVAKPNLLYIENNTFSNNRAQGVYCEGAVLCSFHGNTLLHNNKEGICFDWGSALNFFQENIISQNGERARLSQEEVRADFIEEFPLLADGSSSSKLPGISIDNGCLNYIINNEIHNNFGGGIKMVRTGIANLITDNNIFDNAAGRNEIHNYFNGVFYGGKGAGSAEFQTMEVKLDFMPSEHNICSKNSFHCISPDKCIGHDKISGNNLDKDNRNLAQD